MPGRTPSWGTSAWFETGAARQALAEGPSPLRFRLVLGCMVLLVGAGVSTATLGRAFAEPGLAQTSALPSPTKTAKPAVPPAPALPKEPLEMAILSLNNIPAVQAAEIVRPTLGPGATIFGDDRLNRLIVRDTPANLARLRALVVQLDVPTPSVCVHVQMHGGERAQSSGAVQIVQGRRTLRPRLALPTSTHHAEEASLDLLTLSGSEAILKVGERVPRQAWQGLYNYALGRGLVLQGVVWQDVSTGLAILPHVRGDQSVELEVYPHLAWQAGDASGVVRYRDAATRVRLRPGQTVTIASYSGESSDVFRQLLGTSTVRHWSEAGFQVSVDVQP